MAEVTHSREDHGQSRLVGCSNHVVVANPNAYDIRVVDGDRMRYTVKRPTSAPGSVTTFKEMGGLHADSRGRLWVISDPRTGNSVADVYSGATYLGTIDLGCRGSVTLSGAWMAILCTTTQSATKDVELRVFRIVSS